MKHKVLRSIGCERILTHAHMSGDAQLDKLLDMGHARQYSYRNYLSIVVFGDRIFISDLKKKIFLFRGVIADADELKVVIRQVRPMVDNLSRKRNR